MNRHAYGISCFLFRGIARISDSYACSRRGPKGGSWIISRPLGWRGGGGSRGCLPYLYCLLSSLSALLVLCAPLCDRLSYSYLAAEAHTPFISLTQPTKLRDASTIRAHISHLPLLPPPNYSWASTSPDPPQILSSSQTTVAMVFTPTQRAHTGPGGCPSPLILATHPPSFSPLPTAALHSATSGSSTPNSAIPPIRRFSTSSFSKLSEFHLDDDPEPINGAAANAGAGAGAGGSASSTKHMTPSRQASYNSVSGLENGVKGVRYVDLSLDPSEWRVHVFKKKVLAILRKLVSEIFIDSALGVIHRGRKSRKSRAKSRCIRACKAMKSQGRQKIHQWDWNRRRGLGIRGR